MIPDVKIISGKVSVASVSGVGGCGGGGGRSESVSGEKNRVTKQGRREVEVGTLLQNNDENNVIAESVLSYFLVFKLQV